MDGEPEELQFLGLASIFAESAYLVADRSHRRLFSQIAAALVLPLSLLFLAHIQISHLLFTKIDRDEAALDLVPPDSPSESRLLDLLSSDWSLYLLFKSIYLVFLLVFSLLSTSAVVYTVASIFTAKEISLKTIFAVVPKVWKRLMSTFLWAFLILVAYNMASAVVILFLVILLTPGSFGLLLVLLLFLAYLTGLVWISVVWHLASVVSVLEDSRGVEAMKKSRNLIRGKTRLAYGIFLLLNLGFVGIEFGFKKLVVEGGAAGVSAGMRMFYGLLMLVMLMAVVLLGLVVQTVVYFVCKSYHHESIDKSSLADHLEVYLGEYVPLKGRDVQLEQYYA